MVKILYVEDDESSQRLVQRLLTVEGFEVLVATDGLEAIEIAQREQPNLLLIDINIAGLDGYEVTTRLRAIPGLENTPVVAVTAATSQGDRERALVAGCTGYIAKPIDVDRFPDQVRGYLVGIREEVDSPEQRQTYLAEYNQRLARRLEEKVRELQRAQQELQRVEKMKSDFVVLAGHELRTPLTVIHGYLQILSANPDIPGDPEIEGSPKHMLTKVADAVERLNSIVQDLLNVSLIDADHLELAREPIFLHSLIYSILHNLRSFGPRRNLEFIVAERLRELPMLEGDSRRLYQAIGNIVGNAVKYTPDGGRVTIDGEILEDVVHLWVQDTGVGIPPEEINRIFERFYVIENIARHSTSKTAFKGGGLGLGLTVSKGIIEAHGGKIWAESQGYDEERLPGSTVHILLPLPRKRLQT